MLILIKEFEGIIGAIFGSSITLILTHLLKSLGKTKVFSNNLKTVFLKSDEYGGGIETSSLEAEHGEVTFDLELYNSTEVPKSIRNLNVKFYNQRKQLLFSILPQDEATRKFAAAQYRREVLSIVNIPSKQLVKYEIHLSIDTANCEKISLCKYIYFEYTNLNGKTKEKLIHTF